MYAVEPSWITLASTNSYLLFVASVADIKYFALLYTVLSNVFSTDVVELATVVVASAISECESVALAVAKARLPAPSVFKNCPVLPSDVGKLKPLILTVPVPLPDSSRLHLMHLLILCCLPVLLRL